MGNKSVQSHSVVTTISRPNFHRPSLAVHVKEGLVIEHLALVIGRMRAVVAAEGDRSASRLAARGVLGMSIVSQRTGGRSDRMLDQSPVLWYETRRKQYTPWIRALLGLYCLLAILFTVLALFGQFVDQPDKQWLAAR
jgi:hypothetical protein